MSDLLNAQLLYDVLRVTTPLLLLGLAGVLTLRAGVLNIALEGLLLAGAFGATLGAGLTGSAPAGALTAVLAGGLLAAVFAYFTLRLRANIFIVGLATNAFAAAATVYATFLITGREGTLLYANAPTLERLQLPLIADWPPLAWLSGHTALDYLALLLVLAVSFLLFQTPFGLRLRAVGEDAKAAYATGLPVKQIQLLAILGSGLLAGLAGAHLALTIGGFVPNMGGGRGWIGLVAAIVGGGTAWGAAAASALFGLAEGLANSLQITVPELPTQLLFAGPYLITLVVLVVYSGVRRRRSDDPYA